MRKGIGNRTRSRRAAPPVVNRFVRRSTIIIRRIKSYHLRTIDSTTVYYIQEYCIYYNIKIIIYYYSMHLDETQTDYSFSDIESNIIKIALSKKLRAIFWFKIV